MIKGKGFILRHVKMSDAQMLFEIEQDKKNQKNMMSYDKNINQVKESIKKKQKEYKKKKPSEETFIIEFEEEPAGYVSIHDLNQKFNEHKGIISYAMHPSFRGKGLMTKAVKLITKYAFKKHKLKRLSGRCRTFNKGSAKILEKAGYKLEGIHKKELCKNGKYLDNMYWAIVK